MYGVSSTIDELRAWRPLITNLGYPLGFLIVIVGRQQFFTENTLTPIIPFLARHTLRTLAGVLKLWVVVLVANLAGAHLFAWVVIGGVALVSALNHAQVVAGKQGTMRAA